jgi:signal peptidase II
MRKRDALALVAVLCGSVGCDQITKQAATRWLSEAPTASYLGDMFRLTYTENRGAFLGLGSTWPETLRWLLFTLLSSLLVGFALWITVKEWRAARQQLDSVKPAVGRAGQWRFWGGVSGPLLVVAGGVGNLIDRMFRDGAVVDFMNMGIGSLRTGIFNVADVYIMVGMALWLLWLRSPAPAATNAG